MKKKRRRHTRKRRVIVLRIKIAVFCIAVLSGLVFLFLRLPFDKWLEEKPAQQTQADAELKDEAEKIEPTPVPEEPKETEKSAKEIETERIKARLNLNSIYSFLQGPVSWNGKIDWSGSWCNEELAGNKFGAFGCGLCGLANIYSTLTSFECSPIDMYEYARDVSAYSPVSGYGAIDWPEMVQTLNALGFTCELRVKDNTFEDFCESVDGALTTIALVSRYADGSYWTETEGHYVNLWLYNKESQEIFLADSGNPEHNRSWIPLRYVYDSLKPYGDYQYMVIYSYEEERNTWRHSGITEDWTVPEYYQIKENAD